MSNPAAPHWLAHGEAFPDDSLGLVQSVRPPTRTQRTLAGRLAVMPHEAFAGQEDRTDYVPATELELADKAVRREKAVHYLTKAALVLAAGVAARRVFK